MSIGPLNNVAGSVAGSPMAQTHGSETERTQHETGVQQRRVQSSQKAESAAGVGETDGQDHETDDRDADGRRPWERSAHKAAGEQAAPDPPRAKDATGQSGNLLDLAG